MKEIMLQPRKKWCLITRGVVLDDMQQHGHVG